MVGIFGPQTDSIAEHVKSITDMVEIPFIDTRWFMPSCIVTDAIYLLKLKGKFYIIHLSFFQVAILYL